MKFNRKIPSLVELCIQTTIDNLRYLGDVGETDLDLLKDILPHCTEDQLMHIEKSTQGRDLSPVTNKLWRRFYEKRFGVESLNAVVKRMKSNRVYYTWCKLYDAKLKELDRIQQEQVHRLRELYEKQVDKKQSRQIQVCAKIPPSSKKRSFWGGSGSCSNFSSTKGNLMKKARMETLNSHEARVHAAMKKNALQKSRCPPRPVTPIAFHGKTSASSSKSTKPLRRA